MLPAITLSILVIIGLAIQAYQSADLIRKFRQYEPVSIEDERLPRCAVVLSLRGCDPGLDQTIEKLLAQNYPDFELIILLDHESDPARQLVDRVIADNKPSNLQVRVIDEHSPTCALIANNLSVTLPDLAEEFDLIAWVDADAATWPDWLRTLVTPLIDSELSVVYGNRWYMPKRKSFANIVRFIWNYGSVQQMVFFKYPWAGTLAMKSSFIRETKFIDALKLSLTNDTQIFSVAKRAGKKIAFHPGMMLINQEDIRFPDFYYWMSRQLIYGRLYHPTWPLVLGTGIATGIAVGCATAINLLNLLSGNWIPFLILTTALVIYWIVWVLFVFQLDAQVSRMVSQRGEPSRWWSPTSAVKIFLYAPAVQFIFLAGLFKATFMKTVKWRGIDYQVHGPFDIRMTQYRPYHEIVSVESSSKNESIL